MALPEKEEIFYVYKRENENYEGLSVGTLVGLRRPYLYGVLGQAVLAFFSPSLELTIFCPCLLKHTPSTRLQIPFSYVSDCSKSGGTGYLPAPMKPIWE